MSLSACLIGDDSLLIQCGEILLTNRHYIPIVVSSTKKIQDWAKKNNITVLEQPSDLLKITIERKFDYIFNITNNMIFSDEIIKLAKMAISYHNSYLPKYAGFNSTTWAIINDEKSHGVTWHLISNKTAQGDILKQQNFPVLPQDSAFTLNLRCYEYAIESFQSLLSEIEDDIVTTKKQNLANVTYYSAKHQLPNFGFIDWSYFSAEFIERLARSLSFGHYENKVGTIKIYLSNAYLSINKLKIIDSNINNLVAPGTVIAIEETGISITTTTKAIKICEIYLPNEGQISIVDFAQKYDIKVGHQFQNLDQDVAGILSDSYSKSLQYENFWIKNLLDTTEHSLFSNKILKDFQKLGANNKINLKSIFRNRNIHSIKMVLTTAILIYLYRLNNHELISVFLLHKDFSKFYDKAANFLSYLLPLNFKAPEDFTLEKTLNLTEEKINFAEKNYSYHTDVFTRHPVLKNKSIEHGIVINFGEQLATPFLPTSTFLYFQLDENEGIIEVYHRFKILEQSPLKDILSNLYPHIINILIELVNNQHLSMHNFSFLMEHERYRILRTLSVGKKRFTPEASLISLFENQVAMRPHHTAILERQNAISYAELWETSKKISNFIKQKSLPEQSLVGIYLDRRMELIAVILGILDANTVYVPIDVKYTFARVEQIIDEAKITTIFTEEKYVDVLHQHFSTIQPQLNIYSAEKIIKNNVAVLERNTPSKKADSLVYVMFTSGTTGKPKGVMVTQDNVINYCYWFIETNKFCPASIIDFSSSIAFDLSIPCTIAPLLAGGTMAICSERDKIDPKKYLEHLKNNHVTHVETTPGYMHLLLNYPQEVQGLSDLKWLLLGADTVSKTDVIRWQKLCPQHQLVNEYGPTETTVAVSSYIINQVDLYQESTIPIGRPGYNTQFYVLDKYKNLCPIGMQGELFVAGSQVSLGYLNQPLVSEKKFIVSHLKKVKEVMYNTGDLVCWLPDGNLQFFGRNDNQIKLLGYRIEPAEIEAALMSIPGINQAVVVLQEEQLISRYLKAYLVCDSVLIYEDEVRKKLSALLPTYMLPKQMYVVKYIPLKENDKIDYKTLSQLAYTFLANNTTVDSKESFGFQNTILKIWQTTFNKSSITINDNFFDIGGDSMLALQIIAELRNHYSIEIPLRHLFEYPTVVLLANKMYELFEGKYTYKQESHREFIIQLSVGSYPIPIFLIHPIGGTIFWYQQLATLLQGKYTVYGIQDPNIDSDKTIFTSLSHMAEYYLSEINKIYSGTHYCIGGASFGSSVAYEMANQLTKAGKKIQFLGLFDGWASYPEPIMQADSCDLLQNNHEDLTLISEIKEILIKLERYRKQLLINYKLPQLKADVSLFKAIEKWELFEPSDDSQNGWGPYVEGNVKVYNVPGNHETMFFPPNVDTLAKIIDDDLMISKPIMPEIDYELELCSA